MFFIKKLMSQKLVPLYYKSAWVIKSLATDMTSMATVGFLWKWNRAKLFNRFGLILDLNQVKRQQAKENDHSVVAVAGG